MYTTTTTTVHVHVPLDHLQYSTCTTVVHVPQQHTVLHHTYMYWYSIGIGIAMINDDVIYATSSHGTSIELTELL